MSTPTVTQQPGYTPGILDQGEINRFKWVQAQPGFSPDVQGPPTPFAMKVHNATPLSQYFSEYQSTQYALNANTVAKYALFSEQQLETLTPEARMALNKKEIALDQAELILKRNEAIAEATFNKRLQFLQKFEGSIKPFKGIADQG